MLIQAEHNKYAVSSTQMSKTDIFGYTVQDLLDLTTHLYKLKKFK